MSSETKMDFLKGKIVILEGQSQYNVLNKACHLMAQGMEENGYQVKVLDLTQFSDFQSLAEAIITEMNDSGLFLMSFNAIYHDVQLNDGTSFYGKLGYKTLGFLVDHPYYHKARVERAQEENIYIGCIDPDHVSYINHYYPSIKHTAFLPHFSFQSDHLIPYEERTIELYYPGSYKNPEEYKNNLAQLPKVFADIAAEAFKRMLKDKNLTLEEALKRYLASVNFEYSQEDFVEIIGQIYFVDHYVRDWRRDSIVRTILKAGIDITVSGKGWDDLKREYPNLHIIGEAGLDIEENIEAIANSKILFNTFPNFKNGTHERIFTAMRNGCVCLTDPSGYLLEQFENNEDLVYYDIDKIDRLPAIVRDLLENPEKAMRIAENGYKKACMEYNEKNTAKRILEFMGYE